MIGIMLACPYLSLQVAMKSPGEVSSGIVEDVFYHMIFLRHCNSHDTLRSRFGGI